jgi:hypothetical protein
LLNAFKLAIEFFLVCSGHGLFCRAARTARR